MKVIEKQSKESAEKVIGKAVKFFAGSPPGLKIKSQDACCVEFEGGGGFVNVEVTVKGKGSTVEIETREWDYWVAKFLTELK
jgi:hypothetical protein